MFGPFDDMFDFDHDGEVNGFERAAGAAFLSGMMDEDEAHDDGSDGYDSDDGFGDGYRTEFEEAGLDADELEFMDPEERREALEDAGLDPDEYDF